MLRQPRVSLQLVGEEPKSETLVHNIKSSSLHSSETPITDERRGVWNQINKLQNQSMNQGFDNPSEELILKGNLSPNFIGVEGEGC